MQKFIRLLSAVMTLALLVGSANITLAAIAAETHAVDEFDAESIILGTSSTASETEETAYIIGEDDSLRKENEKHFRMSDGSYVVAVYPEAVHYLEDNEWKEIDNTLSLAENGYVNAENNFTITFSSDKASSELYTLTSGEHSVKLILKENSENELGTYVLSASSDRKIALQTAEEQNAVSFDVKPASEAIDTFKEANPNATKEQIEEIAKAQNEENMRQRDYVMSPKNQYSSIEYADAIGSADIEYIVTPASVKENIILESAADGNVFTFLLKMALMPELNEDGSLDLKDGNDVIFTMPAPYMYDANGTVSYDVSYSVSSVRGGIELSVTADETWLASDERAYPVTIDPTVTIHKSTSSDWNIVTEYITSTNMADFHQGDENWYMGYGGTGIGHYYSYLKVKSLPDIPYNCKYYGAQIHMWLSSCEVTGTSDMIISAREAVAGNWRNQFTGTYNPNPIVDHVTVSENSEGWITFDVTNVARDWLGDTPSNTGLVFTATAANGNAMSASEYGKACFIGYTNTSTNVSGKPFFSLAYRNDVGIEGYYSYHTVSADRAGTAAVNEHTGDLTLVRDITDTVSYVYNSPYGDMVFSANQVYNTVDYSNMKSANGWRLSLQQSVVDKTLKECNGVEVLSRTVYIYTDGDGTEHYFYDYDGDGTFNDEDGLGLEMVKEGNTHTMTDEKDNRMIFIHGYLSQIIDSNGNITALLYDTGTYSAASTTWHPKSSTTGGKNQLKKSRIYPRRKELN